MMMKPYWKPQHEVFIRCVLKHEDPTKAYCTAYPKAKPASARVGGIRLSGYPHIRQRIEPIIKERKAEKRRKALETGVERERKEHERRLEIRATLYKVIMKQLKRKRVFIVKGQPVIVEDDPSIDTILNAIVLDQRLEAGYNNWLLIESRFARIMNSLQPRQKREQTVIDSSANAGQPSHTLTTSQTALQQKNIKLPSLAKEGTMENGLPVFHRGWLKSSAQAPPPHLGRFLSTGGEMTP